MNGIALLKAFRSSAIKHKENISFVLLTSSESDQVKAMADSLGASTILSKPLSEETFAATIRRIAQRHKQKMVH